jgi:tetratricopeptide (TPR) repeat protein
MLNVIYSQQIDLSKEYSMSEFRKGIIAFHNGEYELAITFFTKALSYKFDNNLASYFLGESYRKAGYEKNALSVWNNLLAMGFEDRTLKLKISELYFSKGNLSQINITKSFLIKKDLRGLWTQRPLHFL